MNYPEYRADLQRIHESEVFGRAVFDTAARLARDSARRDQWLALRALEEKTLARYLDYMRSTAEPVQEPRGWALKGRIAGAALGLMPWRLAMQQVADATRPFLETFRRLEEHAEDEDREFFAYVCAHEKAIEAFAHRELAGESNSLEAVERLLADQETAKPALSRPTS